MNKPFDKVLNWYFSKNSLPYWCIFLIDCAIVMTSGALVYLVFHSISNAFDNTFKIFATMSAIALLSIPGFRLFHTYSGFMRYSSFVDLMRVAYGNLVTLGITLVVKLAINPIQGHYEEYFVDFRVVHLILIFLVSTLLMWALRVFVKSLYEVAFSNTRAMRVLIYGAMSGGVGMAKNIRSQRPRKYVVKGFITHYKNAKHQEIMGEKVYSVDEDLTSIIKDNDIEAVLVSPYRTTEFRNNQAVQDAILMAGAKILMAQSYIEMNPDDVENTAPDYTNLQMREVSVEELLPRSEIRVNMASIGEFLSVRGF